MNAIVRYFAGSWLGVLAGFVALIGAFTPELSSVQFPAVIAPIVRAVLAVSVVTALVWFRQHFSANAGTTRARAALFAVLSSLSTLLFITSVIMYLGAPFTDDPTVDFSAQDFTLAVSLFVTGFVVWFWGLWLAVRFDKTRT